MPDVPAGKVPVIACVTAAWKFFFANWRLLAPAAIAPALANGLGRLLPGPAAADTSAVNVIGASLGDLPVTIVMVFFTAAVLRKALRGEFLGPSGLAFGQDEARLLGVMACMLAIFALPIGLMWYFLQTFVFDRIASSPAELNDLLADPEKFTAAVTAVLGEGGLAALDVLLIAVLVLGVIALVRFSIVNAATIGERKIVFLRTWPWSKRNVLRILAALMLTNLPALLATTLVSEIVVSVLAGGGAALSTPMAALAATLVGFISALLSIPAIALGAELYRGLRPPEFVAK